MSLFIRCEWLPGGGVTVEDQIRDVVRTLGDPVIANVVGTHWDRLGRSKREALAQPVVLDEIVHPDRWRKSRLAPDSYLYLLSLWNGRDDARGANLSVSVHSEPTELNTYVISIEDPETVRSSGVSWRAILDVGETLANGMGGLAVIQSRELERQARERGVEEPDEAAYAAFWGTDLSGKNAGYRGIVERGFGTPYRKVACDSWEDVRDPSGSRLREVRELLKD